MYSKLSMRRLAYALRDSHGYNNLLIDKATRPQAAAKNHPNISVNHPGLSCTSELPNSRVPAFRQ